MKYVKLEYDRERIYRIVFEDIDGEVDDKKALLHANRWNVYVNENQKLIKHGCLLEVVGSYEKKVLWELLDNHVIK